MCRLALGLVADQEFEHQLPRRLGALARGLHFHARCRPPDAGGRQHPLALDLDHAGAAIAVGAVARLWQPAEMRDLDAVALRHLPDRFARFGLDLGAVQCKADRLAHALSPLVRSPRKCFTTILTGFIAAWPSPQIDASVMTRVNSARRSSSQRGSFISITAFS